MNLDSLSPTPRDSGHVTHKAKCYVYVCAGCRLFDVAERSDRTTCSGACRTRAHRSGRLKFVRELARKYDITVASILQAEAIRRLRPDLATEIAAGKRRIADVQPEMWNAFLEVLRRDLGAAS